MPAPGAQVGHGVRLDHALSGEPRGARSVFPLREARMTRNAENGTLIAPKEYGSGFVTL